jgi:hypothetical protein
MLSFSINNSSKKKSRLYDGDILERGEVEAQSRCQELETGREDTREDDAKGVRAGVGHQDILQDGEGGSSR